MMSNINMLELPMFGIVTSTIMHNERYQTLLRDAESVTRINTSFEDYKEGILLRLIETYLTEKYYGKIDTPDKRKQMQNEQETLYKTFQQLGYVD
jgi:hypothetical protein